MVHRNSTWILVADGARARVFASRGTGKGVTELPDRAFIGSRQHSRDLGSDRPGRAFDSTGFARHAMEPPTDPHRRAEGEFLRAVVEWLIGQDNAGKFDHLIVIAPPRALGQLRQFLTKALIQKLVQEIALDLTQADAAEIETHLGIPEAS
jgi:protein required for attachment to host cells